MDKYEAADAALPCPFCGERARVEMSEIDSICHFSFLGCRNDDCPVEPGIYADDGPAATGGHNLESALADWNRRAPAPPEQINP